jgi:hypothetical protein
MQVMVCKQVVVISTPQQQQTTKCKPTYTHTQNVAHAADGSNSSSQHGWDKIQTID